MNFSSVNIHRNISLKEFLHLHHFEVETVNEHTLLVAKSNGLPICLHLRDDRIYFQADLGRVSELGEENDPIFYKLLDLNTEIQSVSVGISSVKPDDPRLVLIESRETDHLSDQELFNVLELMEHAADKIELLLSQYLAKS